MFPHWDWWEYARSWNPNDALHWTGLTVGLVQKLYESICISVRISDPLEKWHELVCFVAVNKRDQLKGEALYSQSLYEMASMLRKFRKDLIGEDLPEPTEIGGTISKYIPEKELRSNEIKYLEYLANDFKN